MDDHYLWYLNVEAAVVVILIEEVCVLKYFLVAAANHYHFFLCHFDKEMVIYSLEWNQSLNLTGLKIVVDHSKRSFLH